MPECETVSPLLPVLEQLHINFHAARQAIERELAPLKAQAKAGGVSDVPAAVERISALQTEIRQFQAAHTALVALLRTRLDELPALAAGAAENAGSAGSAGSASAGTPACPAGPAPSSTALLVLCATYLGERGYTAALNRLLALNPDLRDLVDVDLATEEARLVAAVTAGDLSGALAWCHAHRSALKKCDPSLQFALQQRQFAQSAGDTGAAVDFARKAFRKLDAVHFAEVSAGARQLYAWPPPAAEPPLAELAQRLRAAMRHVYCRPAQNPLVSRAMLGLAAVKTRRCSPNAHHPESGPQCPACNPSYAALTASVPAAHHAHSKLDPVLYAFPSGVLAGGKLFRATGRDPGTGETVEEGKLTAAYAL